MLPDGIPSDATEVIGGGQLLCITSPLSALSRGNGKEAVSQIGTL